MAIRNPSKKGDYIVINGKLWRATTKAELRKAAAALTLANRTSAPITYWDGYEWEDTAFVVTASR